MSTLVTLLELDIWWSASNCNRKSVCGAGCADKPWFVFTGKECLCVAWSPDIQLADMNTAKKLWCAIDKEDEVDVTDLWAEDLLHVDVSRVA
jgi:hypothetical protein